MINLKSISRSKLILGGAAYSGEGGGYGFGRVDVQEIDKIISMSIEKQFTAIDLAPYLWFLRS